MRHCPERALRLGVVEQYSVIRPSKKTWLVWVADCTYLDLKGKKRSCPSRKFRRRAEDNPLKLKTPGLSVSLHQGKSKGKVSAAAETYEGLQSEVLDNSPRLKAYGVSIKF